MAAEDYYDDDMPPPNGALATVQIDGEIVPTETRMTPAQAKDAAVGAVTLTAYAKAGELKLTKEESDALGAAFPDEAFRSGAGGDDKLIYIEHVHLRERLNNVLGRGAAVLVTRSHWTEEYKTRKGDRAVRVYAQVMLVARGCFVSESVGDMTYYPHNDKTTYSDAMRGSVTAAFRRCAADFGIGLQAWSKNWCDGWWQRNPTGRVANKPAAKPEKAPSEPAKAADGVEVVRCSALLERAAKNGSGALKAAWQALTKEQRTAVGATRLDGFKKVAAEADAAVTGLGDAHEG